MTYGIGIIKENYNRSYSDGRKTNHQRNENYSRTNPQFFSSGHFSKDLIEDYPELELEDIKAALLYAAKLVEEEKVYNIGA